MDQILGWTATVLFSAAIAIQTIKIIRSKTIDGVSSLLFTLNLLGNCIALAYAILIWQPPLMTKYILGGMVSALGVWAYYAHKDRI